MGFVLISCITFKTGQDCAMHRETNMQSLQSPHQRTEQIICNVEIIPRQTSIGNFCRCVCTKQYQSVCRFFHLVFVSSTLPWHCKCIYQILYINSHFLEIFLQFQFKYQPQFLINTYLYSYIFIFRLLFI